jgi:site-specific DNA-cytosine methylase
LDIDVEVISTAEPKASSNAVIAQYVKPRHQFKDVTDLIPDAEAAGANCWLHDNSHCQCDMSSVLDIFVAGFPCQPFSIGRNDRYEKGSVVSHELYRVMLDIVKVINTRLPEAIVLENVPGMKRPWSSDDGEDGSPLEALVNKVRRCGYTVRVLEIDGRDWFAGPRGARLAVWRFTVAQHTSVV